MPYPSNVDPGYGILYFNVHDYGATGDGTTYDSNKIMDCINASVDDSVIFFPPGTYIADATIQIPGKRTVLGTNSSTIKMADGANLVAVLASQAWLFDNTFSGDPIKIANLVIDGNRDNNLSGDGIVIMNFDSIIRECYVHNCADNGIVFSSVNHSSASISNSCSNDRIESCKVEDCSGYGIYGQDTNGKLIDYYIESNIVGNTELAAIKTDRATASFVQGNLCFECQTDGIYVDNCYASTVIGNEITAFGQDITFSGACQGLTVQVIGSISSVVVGNIISSTEPGASIAYRYLMVTFGGITETKCLVLGNHMEGGWDANANNPADPTFSQAIFYHATAGQISSGMPAHLYASHNQYGNVGSGIEADGYITHSALEFNGDIQLDKHLVASNSLTGAPVLAALTNNGTTPPTPTFSTLGGTDVRGIVQFGSGGSPSSGDQASATFAKAYATAPIVVISPQNAATAALGLYVSSVSATLFKIAAQNAPSGSQGGTTYSAAFMVIG